MSKIIDGNELGSCERWNAPQVTDVPTGGNSKTASDRLTVRDIEAIQQRAYEDGFRLGHQEGLDAARNKAQYLDQLLMRLDEPLIDLDEQVIQELVTMVKAVTHQLVRREMKSAPEGIVAIIREAVGVLPSNARGINIHLHPDDARLVRSILSIAEDHPTWQLIEDPVMTQGDCRIVTENSQVDATVEGRLNAVISAMLGGERDEDDVSLS